MHLKNHSWHLESFTRIQMNVWMDGRCYSIVSMNWRGMKTLQNVPRQHAEKILTAGYIKHEMRGIKIVGLWDVKPCSLVGGYQCARETTMFTFWVYVLHWICKWYKFFHDICHHSPYYCVCFTLLKTTDFLFMISMREPQTSAMWQGPSWEVNRSSASQEIPPILWNLKVHYHIHKSPPPVPVLSQTDPVHAYPSHFLKIQFNIFLFSTPVSSKWSLLLRCHHQNPECTYVSHMCHMLCPSHSSFFFLICSSLSPNIWTVPSFKGLITSLYIVILSYMLVSRHDHILTRTGQAQNEFTFSQPSYPTATSPLPAIYSVLVRVMPCIWLSNTPLKIWGGAGVSRL